MCASIIPNPILLPVVAGGSGLAATATRLEERLFSGVFAVFRHISVNFRAFCLVVRRNIVYLHSEWGEFNCSP